MKKEEYIRIGTALDIKNPKTRIFYRILEIFPGALSWTTLVLIFVLSWQKPLWIALFIIVFDLLWLLRILYRSFLLHSGYKKMKEHEKTDWISKLEKLESKNWKDYYHLIVLPMYEEPLNIARESFNSLKKCDYPKDKMIVVLAAEELVKDKVQQTVKDLEAEFGDMFFKFIVTWHPSRLPGEIPGKGSNETWAARKAKEDIIDPLNIPYENVIYSSFDIDTVVFPKYFSCLSYHYLTCDKPAQKSFQPIPLFINNAWQASVPSRVFSFSSTFWNTMNQASPERLVTFSSHSMAFKALVEVGFRQTNVVHDDSRIFWQCFLKYDGDYKVIPLYYPISMDAVVAETYPKTMKHVYKQQRRWAYGAGEIPYIIFGFLNNKKIPLLRKIEMTLVTVEGHWAWATASFLIFFLGWLPLILGGPEFGQSLISYNLPRVVSHIMTLSMAGLITSAYFSIILLPPKPINYGQSRYLALFLEWLIIPVVMILFTPIPALDAQTRWMLGKYMGFWPTEKMRN